MIEKAVLSKIPIPQNQPQIPHLKMLATITNWLVSQLLLSCLPVYVSFSQAYNTRQIFRRAQSQISRCSASADDVMFLEVFPVSLTSEMMPVLQQLLVFQQSCFISFCVFCFAGDNLPPPQAQDCSSPVHDLW